MSCDEDGIFRFLGELGCCFVVMRDSSVTPWTAAHQDSLSTGFSKQEYWRGLPLRSPENLPHPGIKPKPSALERGFCTLSQQIIIS